MLPTVLLVCKSFSSEFSAAGVASDAGRGLADFAVGQDDGGRDELGVLGALDEDAGLIGDFRWRGEIGKLVEFVAGRIALE